MEIFVAQGNNTLSSTVFVNTLGKQEKKIKIHELFSMKSKR